MATEADTLTAAFRHGRAEALAVLQEEIGSYRMLKDLAPDKDVGRYAHGILAALERVAEKIRRLP